MAFFHRMALLMLVTRFCTSLKMQQLLLECVAVLQISTATATATATTIVLLF